MIPMAAKPKAERIMPAAKAVGSVTSIWKREMPISTGTMDIAIPYMKPAIILPRRTVLRDTGAERNLSKVRILLSRGIVIGPMDEEAKKSVWATSTGIARSTGIFRPITKDRNIERIYTFFLDFMLKRNPLCLLHSGLYWKDSDIYGRMKGINK